MKSLFSGAQFSRFDLGAHMLSQSIVASPQSAYSLSLQNIFKTIGLDPTDIEKISDPTVRAQFKDDFERCKNFGLDSTKGIACMAELAAKVYAKLQEQEKMPYVAPLAPPPAPTSNLLIPVIIGGVAALGLVYWLATKGK